MLLALLLIPKVSTAFPLRQIGFHLRIQAGRLLVYCFLWREEPELFVPGQAQAMFYLNPAIPGLMFILQGLIALSVLFCIIYFAVTYRHPPLGGHSVLWTFVTFLLVFSVIMYLSRHSSYWFHLRDLRNSFRIFQVFGRRQHLVPQVNLD